MVMSTNNHTVQRPDVSSHQGLLYRADIDALRAIAVIGVLLFHAFPNVLPGGFWGVDVFFVISGFLISRIIWDSIWCNRFSVRDFYGRRIRRIFPALALVMFATWGVAYYQLAWDELARVGRHIVSSVLFIMNFSLWEEGGYFDVAAERKPLLHLWSLSIEEQFYLVWPFLMWMIGKRPRVLGCSLLVLGLASFLASATLAHYDNSAVFYNPLARAWELILGGCVGYVAMFRPSLLNIVPNGATIGLVAIFTAFLWLGADGQYMPSLALVPTLGAALILASPIRQGAGRLILQRKTLIWVGLISYPLYLWHWPLLSFALIKKQFLLSTYSKICLLGTSVLLAAMTYHGVEKLIRRSAHKVSVTFALIISIATLGTLGGYTYLHGFVQATLPESGSQFIISKTREKEIWQKWMSDVRAPNCHILDEKVIEHTPICTDLTRPRLLVWGDSHAASLYPGLHALQEKRKFGITELTTTGCPPLLELTTPHPLCSEINHNILAELPNLDPDIVILHAAWIHSRYRWGAKELYDKLGEILDRIRAAVPAARVVVIGPQLRWEPSLPNVLVKFMQDNNRMPPKYLVPPLEYNPKIPDTYFPAAAKNVEEPMRVLVEERGFTYILPRDIFCEGERCLTRLGDNQEDLLVFDYGHLTSVGSKMFLSRIDHEIFDD